MGVERKPVVFRDPSGVEEHSCRYCSEGAGPAEICAGIGFDETFPDAGGWNLEYFSSSWAHEFTPVRVPARSLRLQGREGRCSAGIHPQVFLFNEEGGCELALAVAWSGNWTIELQTTPQGLRVLAGMTQEGGPVPLAPGETIVTPRVLVFRPPHRTLDEVMTAFSRWHRGRNRVQNAISRSLPVEWNHWWTYEDYAINEDIFLKNAACAARLGFEAMVLDAGWYGATALWHDIRGDWDEVNADKFPHGIRYLSDRVHDLGMKFGLWCEIEALGCRSRLSGSHPEFAARRDGHDLGYVCFANPEVQEWAFSTLSRLITEYRLDWIKLDFNLDPWEGCNRTDHGHAAGDGLYRHYQGYYRVLDRIREAFPEVLLENCGSGGLRLDHEILHHTHCTYLSDNDVTRDKLRYYTAVFHFLPPDACLHWSWSHSRVDEQGRGPFPSFHPEDGTYAPYELDFHMRGGMLGWLGFSHPLMDFDARTEELFARHIRFYRETVREYVTRGEVSMPGLDSFVQPREFYAFCYHIAERDSRLLFVFNLEPGRPEIRLTGLAPEQTYCVRWEDTGETRHVTGAQLAAGLRLEPLHANESRVLHIDPER